MASEKTLQSTIEISGVLSPSLQAAIGKAVDNLASMAEETLESADAATRLVAEMDAQEDVLKTLKKAYAGYVASGEKNSEQAEELKKKIEDVSEEFEENKKTLEEAERAANELGDSMDELGDNVDDAGDEAKEANEGFTTMKGVLANLVSSGIEAAIDGFADLASAAKEAYKEYDGGADIIIAKTGATGEAAADLQRVYNNVSKSVTGDFADIGTAVGEINTRFGLTGDDLEKLSTKFIKFSELNGTDVNGAVDSVQKSLAAFGLDAGEAGNLLDTLNKVGQDTGVSMDTLSELLVKNASSFSQMGLDVHQAAAFLGDIEKSGVTTETAMAALTKASQYAASKGKPLADILAQTSDKMANAKTDAKALQVAYEVFGKKAGANIYEACKNGTLSFEDLDKAMQNNAGSIDSTYEATQDGMDKITLAMQGVRADLGNAVAGFLDEHKDDIVRAIEEISTGVKTAIDWLQKNGPAILGWLEKNLPTIAIALGGISAAIVAFKWGKIIGGVNKAIGAFKAFGATLAANPVGLIIIGITALVVAFKYLWDNCESFRNFWIKLWDKIKQGVSIAVDWIKGCWEKIKAFFTGDNPIAKYFQMGWDNIKIVWDLVVGYFQMIWDNIKLVFSAVSSVLSGDFSGAWEAIKGIFANCGEFFTGVWDGIKQIFSNVATFFGDIFGSAWETVKGVFSAGGEVFGSIKDGIVETFKTVVNSLITGINKVVAVPLEGLNGVLDKISGLSIAGIEPFSWLTWRAPIPEIPQLAAGGFTDGVSIAGEAGTEAVISFDPAYRDKNISIWERAGQLLGAFGRESENPGLISKAGRLLTLDDFSLGSLANGTQTVIYYDFSGFTWSPHFEGGGSDEDDDLMARLKAHEAEFFDWLEEFINAREAACYA